MKKLDIVLVIQQIAEKRYGLTLDKLFGVYDEQLFSKLLDYLNDTVGFAHNMCFETCGAVGQEFWTPFTLYQLLTFQLPKKRSYFYKSLHELNICIILGDFKIVQEEWTSMRKSMRKNTAS